jgi:protein tyrosine phosphatase (PTP) superfamily phosphohydrolase (DUF442 family)
VVINLAPDDLKTSLPGEYELLAALNIAYYHIPVAWASPKLDELRQFEQVMAALAAKRMLIHCQANYR